MVSIGQTIGILGGGQLGKMLAVSAHQLGFRVAVFDPSLDAPALALADERIVASFTDTDALAKFGALCDIITYEFEHISIESVRRLEQVRKVSPSSEVLRISQNRILEKTVCRELGIPTTPFWEISSEDDLRGHLKESKLPAILKTATGGYDGKGQVVIRNINEAASAYTTLSHSSPLILEGFIPFALEVSVVVARDPSGNMTTFPVGQNIHQNGILHMTIIPAPIDLSVAEQANQYARSLAQSLDVVGLLAVEFFVTDSGEVLVNETAPRPHNSGHYTIEASVVSQFEQHIRAIAGYPLGSTELRSLAAVMVNMLGDDWIKAGGEINLPALLSVENCHVHIYGKKEARVGRKMGHFTVLAENSEQAISRADQGYRMARTPSVAGEFQLKDPKSVSSHSRG